MRLRSRWIQGSVGCLVVWASAAGMALGQSAAAGAAEAKPLTDAQVVEAEASGTTVAESADAETENDAAAEPALRDARPDGEHGRSRSVPGLRGLAPDQGGYGLFAVRGMGALLSTSTFTAAENRQAFSSGVRGRMQMGSGGSQAGLRELQPVGDEDTAESGPERSKAGRGGGAGLHGSAFFFDRDKAWGAQNPFTLLTQEPSPGVFSAAPTRTKDWRKQWGGSAGGRLRGETLAWFFAYEQARHNFPGVARVGNIDSFFNKKLTSSGLETLRQRLGLPLPAMAKQEYENVLTALAGETGVVPRTADQTVLAPRLDWMAKGQHLSFQYTRMRASSEGGVLAGPSETYGVASFGNSAIAGDSIHAR